MYYTRANEIVSATEDIVFGTWAKEDRLRQSSSLSSSSKNQSIYPCSYIVFKDKIAFRFPKDFLFKTSSVLCYVHTHSLKMLSELQKIIRTDNLNYKTITEWSPMLLEAQTASKLGQDAYPCTTLIWLAKQKNIDSLWFKKTES